MRERHDERIDLNGQEWHDIKFVRCELRLDEGTGARFPGCQYEDCTFIGGGWPWTVDYEAQPLPKRERA